MVSPESSHSIPNENFYMGTASSYIDTPSNSTATDGDNDHEDKGEVDVEDGDDEDGGGENEGDDEGDEDNDEDDDAVVEDDVEDDENGDGDEDYGQNAPCIGAWMDGVYTPGWPQREDTRQLLEAIDLSEL